MTKFKKGSAEAKKFMAKLRSMKGKTTAKKSVIKSKVGYKSDRLDILKKASPYIKKYKERGYNRKDAIKNANLDASYLSGDSIEKEVYVDFLNSKKNFKVDRIYFYTYEEALEWMRENFEKYSPDMIKYIDGIGKIKKTPMKKTAKKLLSTKTHKDTKSHNVNIRVLSGYKQTPEVILGKVGSITVLKSLVPEVKLRITRGKKVASNRITSAKDVSEVLKKFITPSKIQTQEYALALFLNNNNNVLAVYQFGMGGFTSTVMDKRLLMAAALKLGATGIILCHNHPSGSLTPSDADKRITKQIQEIARLHDINVIDHIILTKNGYLSFAESNLI
jgi:DNA repair protein RadC